MKSLIYQNNLMHPQNESCKLRELVKIENYAFVWQCYNSCKYRLLDVNNWNLIHNFNAKPQFILCDSFGYEVYRMVQTGDFIKVLSNNNKYNWLEVEAIHCNSEFNGSKENLVITLKETENPKYKSDVYSKKSHQRCNIAIRRMVNTISADFELMSETTQPDSFSNPVSKSWLKNFQWNMLLRNFITLTN